LLQRSDKREDQIIIRGAVAIVTDINLTSRRYPMIGVMMLTDRSNSSMADLTKIDAGFATIGQGAGPMMVTWRAGLFNKHGLRIDKPRMMGGAKGVVRGLMAGEIQFGNMAAPAPLTSNVKGETDLIFLTGGINQQFVMGRPGITNREQLTGKKIGFVGDGGLNDALVNFIIEKLSSAGIAALNKKSIPAGGDEQIAALISGRCDAMVITPPESIDAQRKGCKYLIDFAEYGLNYALGGIAARRDYVEKNPEITRKFIKAYVEGMHRYRTDREFTVNVQAEYSGIADRTVAQETYDLTVPGMPAIPYPVVASLQALLDFMSKEIPEAKDADARRFVDERFVRELEHNGFIGSLTESKI
jgi:NitT/TauT family transport system substrate-binding protein